jgi:xanthine dehydrogenase accessory factor
MEYRVLDVLSEQIKHNKRAALAVITGVDGSSPGKEGAIMVVMEDGSIAGTIGGGKVEFEAINKIKECIKNGSGGNFSFELNDKPEGLHMECGGRLSLYVKVFKPKDTLIIAGGGHIGLELYKLGKMMDFYTVIVDDREEFCNAERFPDADLLLPGSIADNLLNFNIDENCYIVIATRGHENDEAALNSVIRSSAGYIGMIGSRQKVSHVMGSLKEKGIPEDMLSRVYSPIGLNLGGDTPKEIAFSIMSELLIIRNNGSPKHMRDVDEK